MVPRVVSGGGYERYGQSTGVEERLDDVAEDVDLRPLLSTLSLRPDDRVVEQTEAPRTELAVERHRLVDVHEDHVTA